ncbi:chromosome-anchoring protein RacA [Anoxybacillus tepidamans]|uniref:Chromosome-anchoring protein RacA n=1 Tax=Anoxybacteroides tepidamans TaxID=265948 RepID=A0A7W8MUI7_9BACL|nr:MULTISPECIES: MerR family transcriptional regulator [Anoxybacillus]MBB5324284.1 chromosome-anchoring protein RacA [Anoxybacillus tepidamans]MCZ0754382.1 MerR family transcriptional regulator [Anoxybacillus sp. J5B_2022]
MELKTSNVAKRLGVSPKTVQRWVKRYNIPCQKNEAGHYVFDAETIALLEQIKFEHGAVLEEFEIEEEKEKVLCPETFFSTYIQPHLDKFTSRLQRVERQMDQKADEVVSFQILQHRQEIEELNAYIRQLEQRLALLEQMNQKQETDDTLSKKQKRRGMSRIMNMFV